MYIIAQAYLRCCSVAKRTEAIYWNTTCGLDLVIVVITLTVMTPITLSVLITLSVVTTATP